MTQWLVIQALCRVVLQLLMVKRQQHVRTEDLYMLDAAIKRQAPPPEV